MKTFELLQELDTMSELESLEESNRKRAKLIATGNKDEKPASARNYVAKNIKMAGRGGAQKNKKGKGSYTRKTVNKNNY